MYFISVLKNFYSVEKRQRNAETERLGAESDRIHVPLRGNKLYQNGLGNLRRLFLSVWIALQFFNFFNVKIDSLEVVPS